MKKLGKKELTLVLQDQMTAVPDELSAFKLELKADGYELHYTFDANAESDGISRLLKRMGELGIGFKDLNTSQSSLEDIFVDLVHRKPGAAK